MDSFQFSSRHFLMDFLKACNDVSFLNLLGIKFQILVPRNEIVSVPLKTILTFVNSNCENCRKW